MRRMRMPFDNAGRINRKLLNCVHTAFTSVVQSPAQSGASFNVNITTNEQDRGGKSRSLVTETLVKGIAAFRRSMPNLSLLCRRSIPS